MAELLPHVEEFHCTTVKQRVTLRWIEMRVGESDGRTFAARTRSSCDSSPACGQLLCGVSCPFRWRSPDGEWLMERRKSDRVSVPMAAVANAAAQHRSGNQSQRVQYP